MKRIPFIVLLLSLFIHSLNTNATHIAGGQFYCDYLGSDNYRFRLVLFRDCYNGIAAFDSIVSIGIFDSANQLISNHHVTLVSPPTFLTSPNNCDSILTNHACYEVGIYHLNVNLPPKAGGYQLAYQRCCRPGGISNLANVQGTGLTCYVTVPDSLNSVNSSPVFNHLPAVIQCINNTFLYDQSANDIDGDQIIYSIVDPRDGGSSSTPIPDPPANPPYYSATWAPGYSLSNIFGGGLSLTIDSVTGMITGMATSTGIYAYAITAREFRNGVYLGESRLDFQINIIAPTGIQDIESSFNVKIAPNPIQQSAVFHLEKETNGNELMIVIYNVFGIAVKTGQFENNEYVFERGNLPEGVYFYRIVSKNGRLSSGKFILE